MLTNHYNTLSKPISPKSICCISQTSVSLYRSAEERSYLSLAKARIERLLLQLIQCKGTKKCSGRVVRSDIHPTHFAHHTQNTHIWGFHIIV